MRHLYFGNFVLRILSLVMVALLAVSLIRCGKAVLESCCCALLSASSLLLVGPLVDEAPFRPLLSGLFCFVLSFLYPIWWADVVLMPLAPALLVCVSLFVRRLPYMAEALRERFLEIDLLRRARLAYLAVYLVLVSVYILRVPAPLQCAPDACVFLLLYARAYTGKPLFPSGKDGSFRKIRRRNMADSRERALYSRIMNLVEEKMIYLNPNLKLHELADMAYTNKVYLSRTIRDISGLNFNSFLNKYRIRYAIRLMEENPCLRIVEIYGKSGFNNGASFNLAFKANTGLTPGEKLDKIRRRRKRSLRKGGHPSRKTGEEP